MQYEGLGRQGFAGGDLIRGTPVPTITKDNGASFSGHPELTIAPILEGKIKVTTQSDHHFVAWHTLQSLVGSGFSLGPAATGTLTTHDFLYYSDTADQSSPTEIPLYYLGCKEAFSVDLNRMVVRLYYVCDISALKNKIPTIFTDAIFMDIRSLLPHLEVTDLANAGRGVALAQWHRNHQFCSKCGSPTVSISSGAKRQCLANPLHKHYPRTDPVIITLVLLDKPDTPSASITSTTTTPIKEFKEKALLGRSTNLPPGTLTCLSGFIDQGESIEEAVIREVKEESGVTVHSVEILGSQPWPLGRGQSCELMIGCVARTSNELLNIDYNEMAECRWVEKEEVLAALENSLNPNSPFLNRRKGDGEGGGESVRETPNLLKNENSRTSPLAFYVPPPYAIAHHLLKHWAERNLDSSRHQVAPQSNM